MSEAAHGEPTFWRTWLIWTAGFLAFPLAGLAGSGVVGRVDGSIAAWLGGTVTGLVLGAGQTLASRRRLDARRWVPATGLGMGVGLLLGATVVDFGTSLADLVLGPAQALALPGRTHRRWIWAVAMPFLWALGWAVTTLGGIAVDNQFTTYGAYGAVTFSALSGLLLHRLLPYGPADDTRPTVTPVEART
jgi:hypothetical protein